MSFARATGILLHPISLPSPGGVGDLGPAAYEFIDWLAEARQGLWQVLPLGPPANGNSPYSSTSAFAGNPLLISLNRLAEKGWLESSQLSKLTREVGPINYDQVRKAKLPLLSEAAENFFQRASGETRSRFDHFREQNAWWLEDFVLYDSLRERHQLASWSHWPSGCTRISAQRTCRRLPPSAHHSVLLLGAMARYSPALRPQIDPRDGRYCHLR
jgi:4-alpha-glucanotransferase